jgi:energy-converting hydrogenase Eha subunit H
MKRLAVKFALAALLATFAIPALAQDDKKVEKDKTEKEVKEKKEVEQIIITRNSDSKEKTVVEINGDKILLMESPLKI